MPGVTAQQSSHCQVSTLDYAISFDGFNCILGAAGMKATVVEHQATNAYLIAANQRNRYALQSTF